MDLLVGVDLVVLELAFRQAGAEDGCICVTVIAWQAQQLFCCGTGPVLLQLLPLHTVL